MAWEILELTVVYAAVEKIDGSAPIHEIAPGIDPSVLKSRRGYRLPAGVLIPRIIPAFIFFP